MATKEQIAADIRRALAETLDPPAPEVDVAITAAAIFNAAGDVQAISQELAFGDSPPLPWHATFYRYTSALEALSDDDKLSAYFRKRADWAEDMARRHDAAEQDYARRGATYVDQELAADFRRNAEIARKLAGEHRAEAQRLLNAALLVHAQQAA